MSNLAINLNKIRNNLKVSQQEVADAIGRSKTAIAKWENGESEPSIDDAIKMASFLNVPLELLISEEKEINQSIYKKEKIEEIESDLKLAQSLLKKIELQLHFPDNINISEIKDTDKKRVPKKKFRETKNSNNIIAGNNNLNNSFKS